MSQEQKGRQKSEESDLRSLQKMFKNLNLPKGHKDINILLLGETGVGKSTFINAFFNYINFPSLGKAKNEKLQVVIPSQFTITDDKYEEKTIKVGDDDNEYIETGASATQTCRSYVYPIPETSIKIRLIDTPGIGDTRGIEQDSINFENILSFIGELKHLNGICILLKPNHSRLTVMFEFCIKQLFSKLHKDASQNLIFVFTNTRSTFYRPGETLPSLKKLLGTLKGVNIPCEKKNIFCTDNESFRFLAAIKNKVQFSSTDFNNFSQSWTQSHQECSRMLTYIIGDDAIKGLIPHDVKNTLSVNEARRLIVQLSQPLADIAQLIQENIRAINIQQQNLKYANNSMSDLKKRLYMPVINLRVKQLTQPTTVCTSPNCSTPYQVGTRQKWHYHQRCHNPCYLTNVPKEIIGSPELTRCAAMNQKGNCKKCNCQYQVHMHIYYETETYEDRQEDESVKTRIMTEAETIEAARSMEVKMSTRLLKLGKERDTIIKITAKFACFLKTNAIAPYNDAYEAYLEYLIDREKSMNEATDFELIKQMERMLREYTEEKNAIMNAISQSSNCGNVITADEIINNIETLYALEIFGETIKRLFKAQNSARKDENRSQTKEYTFESSYEEKKFFGRSFGGRGRRRQNSSYNQRNVGHSFQHHERSAWGNAHSQPGPSYFRPGPNNPRSRPNYHQQRPHYHQENRNFSGISYNQDSSGVINFTYVPQRPNQVPQDYSFPQENNRTNFSEPNQYPHSYPIQPPPYSAVPSLFDINVDPFNDCRDCREQNPENTRHRKNRQKKTKAHKKRGSGNGAKKHNLHASSSSDSEEYYYSSYE